MQEKRGMNRKGQVTIFIIIAIAIVAIALIFYALYPKLKTTITTQEKNPYQYIQSCVEDELIRVVENLSLQGGVVNPENYILYNDSKVEYLCYTQEYYRPCIVQQPMLKKSVEKVILTNLDSTVNSCFNLLKESYEKKGYDVSMKTGTKKVELLPERVLLSLMNYSFTVTKSGSERYDSFSVMLNNNLYELVSIASNIIDWEAEYGDAPISSYMASYPDLKAERHLASSGNKVYILTNRQKGNKFQFAIQGQIWPGGYALPVT